MPVRPPRGCRRAGTANVLVKFGADLLLFGAGLWAPLHVMKYTKRVFGNGVPAFC